MYLERGCPWTLVSDRIDHDPEGMLALYGLVRTLVESTPDFSRGVSDIYRTALVRINLTSHAFRQRRTG